MNNSLVFQLHFLGCLLIGSIIASEQKNIDVRGSYNNDLMCHVFAIGGGCNANTVKADSGTVGGSMNTQHCVIKELLKIGGSINVTELMHVTQCNIRGSLNGNKIEMRQGNVGGSINAQDVFCEKNLNIGGSLYINTLKCATFEVGGTTNVDTIYAAKGKVNGSMWINKEAFFSKELCVKGSLHCTGMKNNGSTLVNGTITAKNSIYNDITIKNSAKYFNNGISIHFGTVSINQNANSTVIYNGFSFSSIFNYMWRYFFGESRSNEGEKSEFDACEIDSMFISKPNNVKQIIELKNNTTVQGDIVFAKHTTKGTVRVSGNSQIKGNVINGTIKYQ